MKLTNYIVLLSFFLIVSCKQPTITFIESQPSGSRELTKIPKNLLGKYFCVNDSASLIVQQNIITKVYSNPDTIPNAIYIDTFFSFDRGDVLKKYKGYYFMNEQYEVEGWKVKKLKLKNGVITIGNIKSAEEIEVMEKITHTFRDTAIPYKVKPTKKQLKQFIKSNGFHDEEIYIKQE